MNKLFQLLVGYAVGVAALIGMVWAVTEFTTPAYDGSVLLVCDTAGQKMVAPVPLIRVRSDGNFDVISEGKHYIYHPSMLTTCMTVPMPSSTTEAPAEQSGNSAKE